MRDGLRAAAGAAMVIGIAVLVVACSTGGAASPSAAASTVENRLVGTSWVLTSIEDAPVAEGVDATLVFGGPDVSGSAGCNTFGGSYTLNGPSLIFGPLNATRMACPEPAMGTENAYLEALQKVTEWDVPEDVPMGTELTLTGEGAKLVFAGS